MTDVQTQPAARSRNRAPRKDIHFIDVHLMIPAYVTNLRDDYGEIEELAATIAESPDRIPALRGYKDGNGYVITDGHRRMMAGIIVAQRTGKAVLLPYYSEPVGYSDVERLADMFLLNEGKKLTLMEQAKGIKKFLDEFKLTPKQIAAKLHKSITYVNNCLLLIDAPDYVQKQIAENIISPSVVINLMKKKTMEEVSAIIKDTIDGMATVAPQLSMNLGAKSYSSIAEAFHTAEGESGNTENAPATDGTSPDAKPFDDGEPIILKSEEEGQFRNSDGGGIISGLKVRVTQKNIDETLEKYNSLGAYKKMIKKYPETTFKMREDKAEEFAFFQSIIEGDISAFKLWERYFHVSSEEELKETLKAQ